MGRSIEPGTCGFAVSDPSRPRSPYTDRRTFGISIPKCKKPNRNGWAKCKKRYKIRWLLDLGRTDHSWLIRVPVS